jgi:G3E family GTPase
MSLVVELNQGIEDHELRESAEKCVRQYAEEAKNIKPGEVLPLGKHVSLDLNSSGRKSFYLVIDKPMYVALFAQHTAEEFDIKLIKSEDKNVVPVELERTWVAQHEHDDEVGSVSIEKDGDVDEEKLNRWLSKLLGEKGVDIFRMKGFLSISGDSRRFVFQGVHMLFDGKPDRPWEGLVRRNQLVFIGRNLDEQDMLQGFEACLV